MHGKYGPIFAIKYALCIRPLLPMHGCLLLLTAPLLCGTAVALMLLLVISHYFHAAVLAD